MLTHPACTATEIHKLEVGVAGTVLVSSNSVIDVSRKGYSAGYTTGNTNMGAASGYSGASYGGPGGSYSGAANVVYGDYADPNDWGSGSPQIAGGGLVRLQAGDPWLDGGIVADGESAGWVQRQGGGSGGGIWVHVGSQGGWGYMRAAGGYLWGTER